MITGLPPSTLSTVLNQGLDVLDSFLPTYPPARIRWPSPQEMAQLARVVRMNIGDNLPYTWGVVDGLNIAMFEPPDPLDQNAYYNSWLSGCFMSNVFVFRADGPIAWCRLNLPGSWHDAKIARPLYRMLMKYCPHPYNIVSDTAFPRTKDMEGKIWAGLKKDAKMPSDRRQWLIVKKRYA